MKHNVVYKKSVRRDLKRLSRQAAGRILNQIESKLLKHPEANPVLTGPFAGLRKLRVGDYRVIYALLGSAVLVLRIAHLRDAYREER